MFTQPVSEAGRSRVKVHQEGVAGLEQTDGWSLQNETLPTGKTPVASKLKISERDAVIRQKNESMRVGISLLGLKARTRSHLKHAPPVSRVRLQPWYVSTQSSRFSLTNSSSVTHPPADGISAQDEFQDNVGEFLTVSDLPAVGHRLWLIEQHNWLQRLPSVDVDSSLPRCDRQRTWKRAMMDGWMCGAFYALKYPENATKMMTDTFLWLVVALG